MKPVCWALVGDRRDSRSLLKEGSVALLLNPRWVVGVEYREKPDNLSFAGESDWQDVFVGYFSEQASGARCGLGRSGRDCHAGRPARPLPFHAVELLRSSCTENYVQRPAPALVLIGMAGCASQPPENDSLYQALGEQAGINRCGRGVAVSHRR